MLKPNEIPHGMHTFQLNYFEFLVVQVKNQGAISHLYAAESWPFLVKTLIQCLSMEISSSKKRLPKLNLAKTLRIVVQRAEDDRFSGQCLKFSRVTENFKDSLNK